jgi:threonine aldolase
MRKGMRSKICFAAEFATLAQVRRLRAARPNCAPVRPSSLSVAQVIDLRSDTVTRPTAAMREAMARAEVGDDVFGEDPSVRALEEEVARVVGKEAALFVPSGTMANQIAIALQTRPGDEVIVGEGAHPVHFEGGAGAALSGVQFSVAGRGGRFTAEEMEAAVQPRTDWSPRTSLVAIENTHNRSGGRVWRHDAAQAVAARARELGLGTHVDGARVWNASAASGVDVARLCAPFDTASVCFSKGLGAPVGSALCGTQAALREARRIRKRWGGGMRQAGVLAAAALYALAHHRARLVDDHANARALALRLSDVDGFEVDPSSVETNIVVFGVRAQAEAVAREARALGVLVGVHGPRSLRAVTHLDVTADEVASAATALWRALSHASRAPDAR